MTRAIARPSGHSRRPGPRAWDDPERERDGDPHEQITTMFERLRVALSAWGEAVDHLAPAR